MSEYRFYSYSDFQFYNKSENFFNLPLERYAATHKPKISEDLSTELNVPYTIFEILVAVMAIVGNLMVIVVFQRDKKLRRRTNYYIVSLAIADFLVGLLGVPFAILASVGLPTNLHACLFTVSLLVVLCTISIFCLVAVSIDRYWAILYPMAYSRNVRTKTAIGIISMCWLAGTIVGFLPLFGWHAQVGENQACLFVEVMDYNYLVFLYIATIITPALLLLAFYAHIYRVIIRQVRQIVTMNPIGESSRRSSFSTSSNRPNGGTMLRVLGAARKRDVKATQNLSVIVLFFMICWIPLYTINCVKAFCPNCYVHPKLTFFCIILSHLNSAVNPVLYAYHLKDFRAALKNLILKILGIEIEQQPDLAYRVSLASQQRLQSIVDKRSSLHSKIYIDSPIWLRQQQQLKKESPKKSAISCSLNSVHQTVAAVASTTTDIKRDIWQIPEVSIGAEETSINGKTDTTITENTTYIFEGTVQIDRHFSYDNKNFSTSINELDDDVFLPATPTKHPVSLDAYMQRDVTENEDVYLNKLPISESNSDYDSFSLVQQNSIVPALSDNSIQTYNPSNGSILSKNFDAKDMNGHNSNSVFMIENDTNLLSPDRIPRIKKISRIPSPFMSKAGRITRSCSCTNDGELNQHSEKFSPLRVVSTIIFPPVKHSSLFHIFDSYKNSDIIGERKRRTSQS